MQQAWAKLPFDIKHLGFNRREQDNNKDKQDKIINLTGFISKWGIAGLLSNIKNENILKRKTRISLQYRRIKYHSERFLL
jgi:hypothetical protein